MHREGAELAFTYPSDKLGERVGKLAAKCDATLTLPCDVSSDEQIDELLRREHDEQYCGIVYVDDVNAPSFVKIFDPNNLGVSCGYSDSPPLPGWILSKLPPVDLQAPVPQPGNRRRWWRRLFAS